MSDHLFPRYHIRPPAGYLNDPNGPIVVDGLVHLYYQYRPTTDMASPVLWGHVTSRDLVHWEYQRPALVPHPLRGDRNGCWSGNGVVDDSNRIRAFYSGFVHGEPLQRTLSAISNDGGYSFGSPREVVPEPPAEEHIRVLRDPFVWREGDSWRMVLGAGTSTGTAMVRLYHSKDLDAWTYLGRIAQMPRTRLPHWDSGEMWECPQILTVDGSQVALVGSWARETGVMNVLSFRVPDDLTSQVGLSPSELHLVDHGPNFYAASAMGDNPWGPLVWGWATEGRSPGWCLADGWSGILTLPRIVTLRADGALASSPIPGLTALRAEQGGRAVVDSLGGLGAQLEFLLEGRSASGSPYTLRLCFGPGEFLDILISPAVGQVSVDRSHASSDPRAYGGSFTVSGVDELLAAGHEIRGFIDGSILELFLPGGKVVTLRFYPTTPPPWRLELQGACEGVLLKVWTLNQPTVDAV